MHLLFIDESGIIQLPTVQRKYFVLGGVIIPVNLWEHLANDLAKLKKVYGIFGEIKWRYFSPQAENIKGNTLKHLDENTKNQFRMALYEILISYPDVKAIYNVSNLEEEYRNFIWINGQTNPINVKDYNEHVYLGTYETLIFMFQRYMKSTFGEDAKSIIICDHRSPNEDSVLRDFHWNNFCSDNDRLEEMIDSSNFLEGLLLAPSHHSVGIQFADMIAGAIYRKYAANDEKFYEKVEKISVFSKENNILNSLMGGFLCAI